MATGYQTYVRLKNGPWLYAKWDFPSNTTRCWSALRLTQMTVNGQVPEPSGAAALVSGVVDPMGLAVRQRKRRSRH